jgi:hypothetical protein
MNQTQVIVGIRKIKHANKESIQQSYPPSVRITPKQAKFLNGVYSPQAATFRINFLSTFKNVNVSSQETFETHDVGDNGPFQF